MRVKTSELSGEALDWLVAKCEGKSGDCQYEGGNLWYGRQTSGFIVYRPSTDWSKGGPIIERERIEVTPPVSRHDADQDWMASDIDASGIGHLMTGPTPLIAAMRCYVASKLGDEVEIPEELV